MLSITEVKQTTAGFSANTSDFNLNQIAEVDLIMDSQICKMPIELM